MTEYVTKAGTHLEVGRIPREKIDNFITGRPLPEPPMRKVEVFGGEMEDVPILDDADYQAALSNYYIELGCDKANLITSAVKILDDTDFTIDLEELRNLGLAQGDGHADLLRYIVLGNVEDLERVVELVFYNSTVTDRGILEAAQSFGVTWLRQPVMAHIPSKGEAMALRVFGDRQAAQWAHYNWEEFSELSGPKQSAVVAFYRLNMRLNQLGAK